MWIVENLWINCRNIVYNWVIMWIIEKTLNYGEILKKKSLDGLKMIIYNCAWCVATIRKGGVYVWRWHSSLKRDRDLKFMVSEQEWALPAAEKFCRQEEQKAERNYPHNSARGRIWCGLFYWQQCRRKSSWILHAEQIINQRMNTYSKEESDGIN